MPLTEFSVVYASSQEDGTIIHCFDGRELVLILVTCVALDDYFGWPWSLPDEKRPTLPERHLVVDRNLAAFEPIIQGKYQRGEYSILNRSGSSLKLIEVTGADIPRGRVQLTDSVIQTARAAYFARA
ncbi:hypothetical protein RZS28_05900 [Methylocapsa polymorpha]|uniref:Uncharacterized protein n=1 Tax=Methylocapsa polymorpha TaxID=3080828 RepID=A0ABZ0HVL9_9HYPH|nr:hypothetical protein RZS28_05900 [Methylocapsa sp. RX1]